MNIKYKLYDFYLKFHYYINKILFSMFSSPEIDDAVVKLLEISPRPVGKYEFPVNKPIDENIDLSIIIPIYNVEKYIEECLLSIINSNTSINYEIICINDGSPDNSFEIVNRIKNMFPTKNIKLICQKNRGFSGARNRGLDEATGKYVMFVDSDDKIDTNMIDVLMKRVYENDYDIVSCGYYTYNDNGIISKHIKEHCYFWGKVIKRDMFENIRLPEGYYFEDMIVAFILNKLCKNVTHIENSFYYYRINQSGITKTASNLLKSIDQFYMTEYIKCEYERLNIEFDILYYQKMIKELGLFLYNRTKNLSQYIKSVLFECVCLTVNNWDIDINQLNWIQKEFMYSCKKHNYRLYKNVCEYWLHRR